MKKDIHPVYHNDAVVKCACGNEIITGSVLKELKTDICSACHPFYTGKQKLIDTAGRVDKFNAQKKLAEEKAEQAKQAAIDKKSGKKGEKYMTMDEIKAKKAEKEEAKVQANQEEVAEENKPAKKTVKKAAAPKEKKPAAKKASKKA